MSRRYVVVLFALCSIALASGLGAQRATPRPGKTVLFVCEHGSAKSLLAKIFFERYAKATGLHMQAVSRGTRADSVVPPWMLTGLATDHVTLGSWRPQTLGPRDLATASYVVSFDVPQAVTAAARAPRAQWDGLPSVSHSYVSGRDAIKAKVRQLVDSLARVERAEQRRERKPRL
jgi:arsenate reductase